MIICNSWLDVMAKFIFLKFSPIIVLFVFQAFTDFSELERIAEVDEDAAADQYHDKSGKYIAERGQEGESGKVDESSAADDIKNERQSLPPPPSNSDRRSKRVRKKRKRKDFLEDFQGNWWSWSFHIEKLQTEVEIYKRKQEREKKERKHALDQEKQIFRLKISIDFTFNHIK